MTTISNDTVDAESLYYTDWMSRSDLPRTLLEGTRGMRLAGETFLFKNEQESDAKYATRLGRSTLYNVFKQTSHFLSGQVFQEDIMFSEDVSEDTIALTSEIDKSGNELNVFAKRVFVNGISKGVSHILVDAPNVGGKELTVADEKALGIRPYFKEVRPEDIIGFRVIDGTTEQIRIKELKEVSVGSFGSEIVDRVRVYNSDGSWELYGNETGSYVLIDSGMLSIRKLPIVTFIPGQDLTPMTGDSPLIDLADLNLQHWDLSSDLSHTMHTAMQPILLGVGVDIAQMVIGAGMMLSVEEGGDLRWVEIDGASISAGRGALIDIEEKMSTYGLPMANKKPGGITATEKAITSGEAHRSLKTWSTEFDHFLQSAFELFGEFSGNEFPENGVSVNKEYQLGMADSQELTSLLKAHEQGIIPAKTVFDEFLKRGVLDDGIEWADIEAQVENDARGAGALSGLASTFFGDDTQ